MGCEASLDFLLSISFTFLLSDFCTLFSTNQQRHFPCCVFRAVAGAHSASILLSHGWRPRPRAELQHRHTLLGSPLLQSFPQGGAGLPLIPARSEPLTKHALVLSPADGSSHICLCLCLCLASCSESILTLSRRAGLLLTSNDTIFGVLPHRLF